MNFINVFVSDEYRIGIEKNCLALSGAEKYFFPLEDIGTVMLENNRCTISVNALSKLSKCGATVFVCDEKHLPSAELLPCNDYYKAYARYKTQISISKPRLKNLWREIIKAKIANQSDCLCRCGIDSARLDELNSSVRSGDSGNVEAQAAAYYFPVLFGRGFTRDEENGINAALNYSYAIVRGIIARQIASRGFLPCVGIFHRNEYNAFNLADDLIEPFRPIVDYFVYNCRDMLVDGLSPIVKKKLFSIVNLEVVSGKEKHSLAYAVEREVESVISYYEGGDKLLFPAICGLAAHEYE